MDAKTRLAKLKLTAKGHAWRASIPWTNAQIIAALREEMETVRHYAHGDPTFLIVASRAVNCVH